MRIIAPSRSLAILPAEQLVTSAARLASLGLRVSFGSRVREINEFRSASVASRIADLHEAFVDPSVRGILTAIGGFNANQLLARVDWDLIAAHPKVFCGYSDITALQNALLARTGLVSYSGPHFSTWAMVKGIEFDLMSFRRCVMEDGPYELEPSPTWSDDAWFLDQENRSFRENPGPRTIHAGVAAGRIVGGNLCTLNLLQGTPWMPSLDGSILFVEEDEQAGLSDVGPQEFDRNLQSLLQVPTAAGLRALVIGRFQPKSGLSFELLRSIVDTKSELARVPVASGFDFGHTTPHFTFPIGGRVGIDFSADAARLTVLDH